jgi:hypothetical protein
VKGCLGRTALGQPCAAPVLYIVFGYTTVRDACGLHMPQIVRWTLRDNDTVSVKQIMKNLSPPNSASWTQPEPAGLGRTPAVPSPPSTDWWPWNW